MVATRGATGMREICDTYDVSNLYGAYLDVEGDFCIEYCFVNGIALVNRRGCCCCSNDNFKEPGD